MAQGPGPEGANLQRIDAGQDRRIIEAPDRTGGLNPKGARLELGCRAVERIAGIDNRSFERITRDEGQHVARSQDADPRLALDQVERHSIAG